MNKLIMIVGASGTGKTTLARALAVHAGFELGLEQHVERPFQKLFKLNPNLAFPNQLDYLLHRAEQEQTLRQCQRTAVMDGGLDLDFHGFTRLFHARGWLTDEQFDVCRRFYDLMRKLLPLPDRIIVLSATPQIIKARLVARDRINIASAQDMPEIDKFLDEWLDSIEQNKILRLEVSEEPPDYSHSIQTILDGI